MDKMFIISHDICMIHDITTELDHIDRTGEEHPVKVIIRPSLRIG